MSEQIRQDGAQGEDAVVVDVIEGGRVEAAAKEPAGAPARDSAGDSEYAKKDAPSNGVADGAREVEIGREWDDGAENRDAAERDIEEATGAPVVPAHAAVAPSAPMADGQEMMTGVKRRRDEDDVEQKTDLKPQGADPTAYPHFQPKRPRQDCFRCGGA